MLQCSLCQTHNLQFDGLAVQLDGADLEVYADGADVALCVGVILSRDHRAVVLFTMGEWAE